MECIMTEKMVKDHIEKHYNEFRSVCRNSHRGFLTENEIQQGFTRIFNNGFSKYINDKGFRLSINTAGWIRFVEDYRLWEIGEVPANISGKEWLLYENNEAAPLDKCLFFELMAAFNVSIKYYEPLRDGAYHDDYKFGHYPGEMIIGHNIWEDDGGLLSDDFQLGSTIKLTDHYGLKSDILINEYISRKECDGVVSHDEYFKGYGTIEGYTKPEGSYMELYPYNGRLSFIDIYPDEKDWDAHDSFHLWKEQIEHEEQWRMICDKTIDGLIQRFMQETSE